VKVFRSAKADPIRNTKHGIRDSTSQSESRVFSFGAKAIPYLYLQHEILPESRVEDRGTESRQPTHEFF
jgi:hypothetical protein